MNMNVDMRAFEHIRFSNYANQSIDKLQNTAWS